MIFKNVKIVVLPLSSNPLTEITNMINEEPTLLMQSSPIMFVNLLECGLIQSFMIKSRIEEYYKIFETKKINGIYTLNSLISKDYGMYNLVEIIESRLPWIDRNAGGISRAISILKRNEDEKTI